VEKIAQKWQPLSDLHHRVVTEHVTSQDHLLDTYFQVGLCHLRNHHYQFK
jgi:hypothetical protein